MIRPAYGRLTSAFVVTALLLGLVRPVTAAVALEDEDTLPTSTMASEEVVEAVSGEGLPVDGLAGSEGSADPAVLQADEADEDLADEAPAGQDESNLQGEEATGEEAPADAPEEAGDEAPAPEADAELVTFSTVAEADAYAAQHVGDIADGRYAITSKLSAGFALDVQGASQNPGAKTIAWTAQTKANQRWDITNVGGGYVTIRSANSGLYLQAGWKDAYLRVVQAQRDEAERGQLWIISRESDGSYKITPATNLARVLDVKGGAKAERGAQVFVYGESESVQANQRWRIATTADILDAEAKAHKADLSNGTYLVRLSGNTQLALAIKGASIDNSAAAELQTQGPTVTQGWTVSHDAKGYVTFVNAKSGKALDVRGGAAKGGAATIQWTAKASGARNQQWIAAAQADGSYVITSALTGVRLVLGVAAAKGGTAAKLLAPSQESALQCWSLAKAPASYAHAHSVEDGLYMVRTALNAKKALDVSGSSTKSGAWVKLWTSKLSSNQFWVVSHDDQGCVHLTNKNSGKELSFENGQLKQTTAAYAWVFEKVSGSTYRIKSAGTGKYLDVSRSNTDNKTNKVILYTKGSGKNQQWTLATPTIGADTAIMGVSQVSQAQAVRYLDSYFARTGRKLPQKWRTDGVTTTKLVKWFWEEGAAEGVRGDVALAQSIHETGWFQFGGDVVPSQYNFAGIGTTGGGVRGHSFKNAQMGIRAQIQHLKAYASTAALNNECIDPRFSLVSRGCAPTIKGLTGRWAVPGVSYDNGRAIYYHDFLLGYLNGMLGA